MMPRLFRWALFLSLASVSAAQEPTPSPSASSVIKPSWETQRQAAAYLLTIPAPRGLITDRNGLPLAQTRVSYNLSIAFPTPLEFTDQQIVDFAGRQANLAKNLTQRPINYTADSVIQHYRNRGLIPFDIASDLPASEIEKMKDHLPEGLTLRAIYLRTYPQGSLAGHVVGYTGRTSAGLTQPFQNKEFLLADT